MTPVRGGPTMADESSVFFFRDDQGRPERIPTKGRSGRAKGAGRESRRGGPVLEELLALEPVVSRQRPWLTIDLVS